MAYTTAQLFQKSNTRYTDVSTFPGTSAFTVMLTDASAEFNTFLDVTADICSSSDDSVKSNTIRSCMHKYLNAKLVWEEKIANIAPQLRGDHPEPSLYDGTPQMNAIAMKLMKLKRDEKWTAMIYNMKTGNYRRFWRQ